MKTKRGIRIKNNLWQARRRCGLELKQVAFLLSRKSANGISHYEKGLYIPNLKTAVRLEIIYQMPLHFLFEGLFEQCREEIAKIRERLNSPAPVNNWFPENLEHLKEEGFCFFADLLKNGAPSEAELREADKHVINLIKTASECRSRARQS